jgi:hypothetical protein
MNDAIPVAARGLVKRYGEIVAVNHVDLTLEAGDVYAYLRPNSKKRLDEHGRRPLSQASGVSHVCGCGQSVRKVSQRRTV